MGRSGLWIVFLREPVIHRQFESPLGGNRMRRQHLPGGDSDRSHRHATWRRKPVALDETMHNAL